MDSSSACMYEEQVLHLASKTGCCSGYWARGHAARVACDVKPDLKVEDYVVSTTPCPTHPFHST